MHEEPHTLRNIAAITLSLALPSGGLALVGRLNAAIAAAVIDLAAATVLWAALWSASTTSQSSTFSAATIASVAANQQLTWALAASIAVMAATRITAVALIAARSSTTWATRMAAGVVCVALAVSATAVVVGVREGDRAVRQVFAENEPAVASPSDTTTTTRPPEPAASTTQAPSTTRAPTTLPATTTLPIPAEWAELDRLNILLIGGDAAPGRPGLRTDTMVLASIDPRTGDSALVSIPRNLARIPFPAGTPLADRFPRGFEDLANAVYPYVSSRPELVSPDAADPGAQAIKSAVAQLLNVPVQYYVLVDMAGFVDVVDSLGGVTINVPARVPSPGNPSGAKHPVPRYIEAGVQTMDGTIALAYARSRSADSDYARMGRQRCLLAALGADLSPPRLATALPALSAAVGAAVSTDIPRPRIDDLFDVLTLVNANGGVAAARTLSLTPPLIVTGNWDIDVVRELASATLTTPPTIPAPPTQASPPPQRDQTPQPPAATTAPEAAVPTLSNSCA